MVIAAGPTLVDGVPAVRRGDPGYPEVRDVYTAIGEPALVLLPGTADETVRALAHARSQPGPLSVRSGGHGIGSIATNRGGTVIDLRRMHGIRPADGAADGAAVTVESGARWSAVARDLYARGLALSSGDSGDVGVGGLAGTGGIGLLGRAHGLTIDRVRAATVVTADSRVLHVSAQEHPDLFWAIRGAAGRVGIVTAFEFEAARTPVVAQAGVAYQPGDVPAFLRAWGQAVQSAPREVSAFLYLSAGVQPFAQATVVCAVDDAAIADHMLQPFVRLPGTVGAQAGLVPYPQVLMSTGEPHFGQQSAVMHTALADRIDDDLARHLGQALAADAVQMLQVRSVGGAINDTAADATAYAHRHQNFCITAVGARPGPAFDGAWQPVRDRRDGSYANFESSHTADDFSAAFPQPTASRLAAVAQAWDPDGVFTPDPPPATAP